MNLKDVASLRLISQQIAGTKFTTIPKLVGWMGAIQAQDYAMAKWAVGVRLPGITDAQVETALNKALILRTHILRPTWHFVAAKDIYWMTELSAPKLRASLKGRHKQLALTEKIFSKSQQLLEKALTDQSFLSRDEIADLLQKEGIKTTGEKMAHLMFRAELDGLVCNGPVKNKSLTYALLYKRVKPAKPIDREKALGMLALRYFLSHGPATIQDFSWWAGLTLTDARNGLAMNAEKLTSENIHGNTYWFDPLLREKTAKPSALLLPAFDEVMISYKQREIVLAKPHHAKAFSANGIFWPVMIHNGQAIGTWKRTFNKSGVIIEKDFFTPASKSIQAQFTKAEKPFRDFLGK